MTTTLALASSVEIATDSKDNPKQTVKVYHDDPTGEAAGVCAVCGDIGDATG